MRGLVKVLLLASVFGVVACGGSGGGSSSADVQDDAAVDNAAPVVSAGGDFTVELVDRVLLTGVVTDDGLPSDTLTVKWSRTDGPASAVIASPTSLETEVSFEELGVYTFSLLGDDGEASNRDDVEVTVINTSTQPSGNVGGTTETEPPANEEAGLETTEESNDDQGSTEEQTEATNESESIAEPDNETSVEPSEPVYESKEHSSGLRLEYKANEVLADSTDIDWMHRMWGGIAQCQGLDATTAYPTIRLSSKIATPESGDILSEGGGNLYRMNLANEFIEVLNSGTASTAGTNQGLVLGEAMGWYTGFQVSDNWQGTDCASWHSGGRHYPSPSRPGIGNVSYVYESSIAVLGQFFTVKSDTTAVDEFTLDYVGKLWEAVAQCHGYTETNPTEINEILVVSNKSNLFAGDKWNETGSYTVNDGGQIIIDSSDLVNIRENDEWGIGLHHWMNAYLDAYADKVRPIYECRDLSGTTNEPVLPIQFD